MDVEQRPEVEMLKKLLGVVVGVIAILLAMGICECHRKWIMPFHDPRFFWLAVTSTLAGHVCRLHDLAMQGSKYCTYIL